jgi:hypothetical protein
LGITGNTAINGTLGVNGATTLNNTTTVSATTSGGLLTITQSGTGNAVTVSGNVGITGETTITGNTTITGTLGVTGDVTITNSNLYITNTANGGGDIVVNGGTDGAFGIFNTTNSGQIILAAKNTSGVYNGILAVYYASAQVNGALNVTGDITAFYTSDQRLKENIVPIPNALEKVISISGNNFDWVQGSGKEGSDVGVIAQEILEILPEAVTTRETGYLAVRYEKIIPLLIEAIKDLKTEVDELKKSIKG